MALLDTKKFKDMIERELENVTRDLEKIAVRDTHNPDGWVLKSESEHEIEADRNDMADEIEDLDTRAETLRVLEQRYENLHIALDKIDTGGYGIDEVDGEPIPVDRLLVNPAARTKVENAHLLES